MLNDIHDWLPQRLAHGLAVNNGSNDTGYQERVPSGRSSELIHPIELGLQKTTKSK